MHYHLRNGAIKFSEIGFVWIHVRIYIYIYISVKMAAL